MMEPHQALTKTCMNLTQNIKGVFTSQIWELKSGIKIINNIYFPK